MVTAEINKKIECNNCGKKFTLLYYKENDSLEEIPEYCAFCGDLFEDAYSDIEDEDDEWEEDDWD